MDTQDTVAVGDLGDLARTSFVVMNGESLKITKDQTGRVIKMEIVVPKMEVGMPGKEKEGAAKHQIEGGSTRSERAPAYHLVPPYGGRRVAARFALGAEKHGEGNWMKSIHESQQTAYAFCQEAYNHMMEHARKMAAGEDRGDDHLGAIGWAVEVLAYAEHVWDCLWTELMLIERGSPRPSR